ncbi:hypothetical protein RUM43_003443 [Polyplax serrata]
MRWDLLPDLILSQIFNYLNRHDRISAGRVCTLWDRALNCPSIWHNVNVNLERDIVLHDTSLAKETIIKYGHHMKRLILTWSQRDSPARPICLKTQIEAGTEFLSLLLGLNIQIKELCLVDWFCSYKYKGNRIKLIMALTDFIRSQSKLQTLSLEKASFRVNEIIRILCAVAHSKSNQLQKLNLRSGFNECEAILITPRYLEALSRLSNLTELQLDYPALSDGVLFILAENTRGRLEHLTVEASGSDFTLPVLSDNAWKKLAKECPKLKVAFIIMYITHYEDVCVFLLPSVPLYSFTFTTGCTWDQSRSRDFRGIFSLLLAYYNNSIEKIHLNIKNNREVLDDLIIDMVEKCPNLTFLQFNGVLRNITTIKKMCEIQKNSQNQFKTFHVRPKFLNEYNYSQANIISSLYKEKLANLNVDFRIEDPTVDVNFY